MKRHELEEIKFKHTIEDPGLEVRPPDRRAARAGRPTGLFVLGKDSPAFALAFCKYPVPGGRPNRRGRDSKSTVLTLPTGRPRLRAPKVADSEDTVDPSLEFTP